MLYVAFAAAYTGRYGQSMSVLTMASAHDPVNSGHRQLHQPSELDLLSRPTKFDRWRLIRLVTVAN